MASGGKCYEENSKVERKQQQNKMKTSGICSVSNGFPGDIRYSEDYQTSPESSDCVRNSHSVSSEEEEDEISVGCPSPVLERLPEASSQSDQETYQRRVDSPLSSYSARNGASCQPQERLSSSDELDQSDERTSTSSASTTIHCRKQSRSFSSEEENDRPEDDYFKPLKKLKMMQIDKLSYSISGRSKIPKRIHRPNPLQTPNESTSSVRRQSFPDDVSNSSGGVKSFSILDILNHSPAKTKLEESKDMVAPSRIVRPWDYGGMNDPGSSCIPPPAHRGLIPPPPMLFDRYHHRIHQLRPKSADFCFSYDTSTCSSSGRSSTGGSDCCTSPDIINCAVSSPTPVHTSHRRPPSSHVGQRKSSGGKSQDSSPLDALYQMTSKTFEELNGESGPEGQPNHLTLFNNRQQPKKKRKSRTAFTNHQIFELEKRFLYQKYLSPADRDEIAGHLGLSNAQVITWFQNRRAKLKRDMEELKKDVESAKVLTAHKSFLENVQNLGILKKKSVVNSGNVEEKSMAVVLE